ncbi:hypothetical protein GTW43_24860 [Streptomyces sp. SID5785]|uniref:hypothetical protein n=1 Tax=Streptomyces sp. SID5785 TaxID=2690309 RepID=UPI001361ADA5|nr:hypothetical protein [Streptomyces sp. SID5785]MZD08286.1 hypothetical protein [Streptomyces sp. SID5785]
MVAPKFRVLGVPGVRLRDSGVVTIWVTVIAAGAGVAGAGIGIVGTYLSERWRARTTAEQERRATAVRLRDERRDVLVRFFAHAKEVERMAERREAEEDVSYEEALDLTSRLWLLHVEVSLLCGEGVASAVHDFTDRLAVAARHGVDEYVHVYLAGTRNAAIAAARGELGVPELPSGGWAG